MLSVTDYISKAQRRNIEKGGFFGLQWPCLGETLKLNCAVCWNRLEIMGTSIISLIILALAVLVKIPNIRKWNQPVTNDRKYYSYLVGTSETTRVTTYTVRETYFNQ